MTGTALSILARCRRLGVQLRADGGRLRFRPVEAVDDALRANLAAHKAELLAVLAGGADPTLSELGEPAIGGADGLPALAAAGLPVAAVVNGFDGGDVEQGQECPLVGAGPGDEHFGLKQGDAVGVADGERFAPGREDAERLEGVAVEQFADGIGGGHAHSVAAAHTEPQCVAPTRTASHGAARDADAPADVDLTDLDRRTIEAIEAGDTIPLAGWIDWCRELAGLSGNGRGTERRRLDAGGAA